MLGPFGSDVPDGGPAVLVVEGVPDGLPEDVVPAEPVGSVGFTAAVVVAAVIAGFVVTGYATLTPQVASTSKAPIGLLNSMHCWVWRAITPCTGSAQAGRPVERGASHAWRASREPSLGGTEARGWGNLRRKSSTLQVLAMQQK